MSEIVGYGRVSSAGQSLDVQVDKLNGVGCTRLFLEKRSATTGTARPELRACLDYVREGDVLVVTRLDRMARSVLDLAKTAERLKSKGVCLRVLDQAIDTSSSEGRLMFSLLGAFAEFENDIRRERQADGIAKAKAKGVAFGRRPALTAEQRDRVLRLRESEGFSVPQLADRFSVSVPTIYRALARGSARELRSGPDEL